MTLVDATNRMETLPAGNPSGKPAGGPPPGAVSTAHEHTTIPNAEKLSAALDALAGSSSEARDAASAALDAAVARDARGLCVALLGTACEATHPAARRLAAATFCRNALRKASWGTSRGGNDASGDDGTAASTPVDDDLGVVRAAALKALVAAPADARRLLADCLRLAAGPAGTRRTDDALVDDVVRAASDPDVDVASLGFLLAVHEAARPFQYFRDPTVTREPPPAALERLCGEVVVPRVLPVLTAASENRTRDAAHASRLAFKIAFRVVRAYAPEAIVPALQEAGRAVATACDGVCEAASRGDRVDAVEWIVIKRALRFGASLVSRHASLLGAEAISHLGRSARHVAALEGSGQAAVAVAAAFQLLDALLSVASDLGVPASAAAAATAALAPESTEADLSTSSKDGRHAALTALVRSCVLPHARLTDADRECLADDPEEYARQHAVGEAAADDELEDALDQSGSATSAGGGTARRAAADFVASLVRAALPGHPTNPASKKGKGAGKRKEDAAGGEDGESDARRPATSGELAVKAVIDEMLSTAPKEKMEKVGKAAAAAGATASYAAPAAEAAMGESTYVALMRLYTAFAGATHDAKRPLKESNLRQFCQRHALPSVAAAASPHVAVAASGFIAAVAPQITGAPLARESLAALVTALERAPDEDDNDDEWAVSREVASWAAKVVLVECPCADAAFGAAAAGAIDAAARRLVRLIEADPTRGAPALRTLAALADASSDAMNPLAAADLARRVVDAFAPFAPSSDVHGDGAEDEDEAEEEDEMSLDAWECATEAVASLLDALARGEAPGSSEGGDADAAAAAEAKIALAAAAAAHVRAHWRAALVIEPPDDVDDDAAPPPPLDAASAPLVCRAIEALRDAAEQTSVNIPDAAIDAVFGAATAWASHLAAWCTRDPRRAHEEGLIDDEAMETLGDVLAAVCGFRAARLGADRKSVSEETSVAAIAVPAAEAAAAVVENTDDAETRRAAARALAAATASCHRDVVGSMPGVIAAATNFCECARGDRSARAALHLLAAVGYPVGTDPAAWMRVRADTAVAAKWSADDAASRNEMLLAAHLAALTAALTAAVAPGASGPDKRLFGGALAEAMTVATLLLEGEGEDDGSDSECEDGSDAEDEQASDEDAGGGVEDETEEEFLQRYAAIARDMAENDGNDSDAEDDSDAEGLMEEDDAFDRALEARFAEHKGENGVAKAFCEWFASWKAASRDDRMRVSNLVDAALLKRFTKCASELRSM